MSRNKLLTNIVLIVASVGLVVGIEALRGSSSSLDTQAAAPEKVTICHAAGQDDTTHYIELTLSYTAAFGQAGHFYEDGTPQAGHENDNLGPCASPSPSPSPQP